MRLSRELTGDSVRNGGAVLNELDTLVRQVRAGTGADLFPDSFDSQEEWRKSLQIGHDWVRLGAYLDADYPIDEARDVFTTGGGQPHMATTRGAAP